MDKDNPAFIVDGIQSLGVHNGVARVQFFRLTVDGKSVPVVELQIPVSQAAQIAKGLSTIR